MLKLKELARKAPVMTITALRFHFRSKVDHHIESIAARERRITNEPVAHENHITNRRRSDVCEDLSMMCVETDTAEARAERSIPTSFGHVLVCFITRERRLGFCAATTSNARTKLLRDSCAALLPEWSKTKKTQTQFPALRVKKIHCESHKLLWFKLHVRRFDERSTFVRCAVACPSQLHLIRPSPQLVFHPVFHL